MAVKADQRIANSADSQRNLPLIVRLLEETEGLDSSALEAVWEAQSRDKGTVEESLMRANLATEQQIAQAYADHYLAPRFDPDETKCSPSPELSTLLPAKLCRDHLIVPVAANEKAVDIAMFSP